MKNFMTFLALILLVLVMNQFTKKSDISAYRKLQSMVSGVSVEKIEAHYTEKRHLIQGDQIGDIDNLMSRKDEASLMRSTWILNIGIVLLLYLGFITVTNKKEKT